MNSIARLGFVGGTLMVIGVFLPWATLSLDILGAQSPGLEIKGSQIGSDIGDIPWGWFAAAAGAAAIAAAARRNFKTLAAVGAAGGAFTVINALTLSGGTVTATANGVSLTDELQPQVHIAWGSFVELVAAAILLVAGAVGRSLEPDYY